MERTEHLLKNGLDKQKVSVLTSLPKILAANNSKGNVALVLDCIKVRLKLSTAFVRPILPLECNFVLVLQSVWQKCESDHSANWTVLLEVFKGLSRLPCATVDGKVLSFPTAAFHDDFERQLELCNEEKKNAVFLLSDEQVAKLVVPLALDLVSEIQQKDHAEAASQAVIAALPRIGGALKKTQVSVMLGPVSDFDSLIPCVCADYSGRH